VSRVTTEADARRYLASRSPDEAIFGIHLGSLGPVGFEGEVVADEALRDGQYVAGPGLEVWRVDGTAVRLWGVPDTRELT